MKKTTGTKQWSDASWNLQTGCENGCRYCYARNILETWLRRTKNWLEPVPLRANRRMPRRKTVMFPTTHDICPSNIDAAVSAIEGLLRNENRILIVSKPRLKCIKRIVESIDSESAQKVMFRFTIGSDDDEVLKFWEPNAPSFQDRLSSLKLAFDKGFRTSVSMEPMLDAKNISRLVGKVIPFVTNTIWMGTMGLTCVPKDLGAARDLIAMNQTPEKLKAIHEELLAEYGPEKLRWKDSYCKLIGVTHERDDWHSPVPLNLDPDELVKEINKHLDRGFWSYRYNVHPACRAYCYEDKKGYWLGNDVEGDYVDAKSLLERLRAMPDDPTPKEKYQDRETIERVGQKMWATIEPFEITVEDGE